MACDICTTAGVRVTSLHEQYRTGEIRFVCYDCSGAIDKKNTVLMVDALKAKAEDLKRFMLARRLAKRQELQAAREREAAHERRR